MKRRSLLLLLPALLIYGCCNSEETGPELPYDPLDPWGLNLFTLNLVKSPEAQVDDLPEWLQTLWDAWLPSADLNRNKLALFQGEWKGRIVFYLFHYNCIECLQFSVFYSNGEEIEWEKDDPNKLFENIREFCYTSKNWKKIREYDPDVES